MDKKIKDKNQIFLSLGSNMGDRAANLSEAIRALSAHKVEIYQASDIFETVPWGVTGQNNFYNIVVSAGYEESPHSLLKIIHEIEDAMGRVRGVRWGPRIIDIDILSFENLTLDSPDLIIPHKYLKQRAFVLKPFAEIYPGYLLPEEAKTVSELLNELPAAEVAGVKRLRETLDY